MVDFSERLNDFILEKDFTSRSLAAAIGVSKPTVNDWRRGKYQTSLSVALKLADIFCCSLDYLMARSDSDIDYTPQSCPPFYLRFRAVLAECGISTYRIQTETSIKGEHFNKWKKGADPLMPTLVTVADYLKVSLDCLVGRDLSPITPLKQRSGGRST